MSQKQLVINKGKKMKKKQKFFSMSALCRYMKENHIPESAVVDVEIHGNELTLIWHS